jgi:hypothetical protein
MPTWMSSLPLLTLAAGASFVGMACGRSASTSGKDAAQPFDSTFDVPVGSGGAVGTGGTIGSGGVLGTGGAGGAIASGGAIGGGGVVGGGGAVGTGGVVGSGGALGSGGATLQSVDSSVGIDGAGLSGPRDATKIQTASLTAAQGFGQPTAPFLLQADLTRGTGRLFDVSAKVLVRLSGCSGDACNQQVTMHLSREETTKVESWLAVIPGEACQNDPGPICDFGVVYAVGIDGPRQNQTCCKLNTWGQNRDVEALHRYLQGLALAQLGPLDGGASGDAPAKSDTSSDVWTSEAAGPSPSTCVGSPPACTGCCGATTSAVCSNGQWLCSNFTCAPCGDAGSGSRAENCGVGTAVGPDSVRCEAAGGICVQGPDPACCTFAPSLSPDDPGCPRSPIAIRCCLLR